MRFLLPILVLSVTACASKPDETSSASCDARARVDGACPGVTNETISTDGISCTSRIEASPADVDGRVAGAAAGACVLLSGGTFGVITLPAGVSLIGKGAGATTVSGIKATGGAAATIRGLTVGASAIAVTGPGMLTIDRVHVKDYGKTPGIIATDTSLTVSRTTIENGQGFGIAALCKTDCATKKPTLSARRVHIKNNKVVGIWAHGVDTTIEGVQVEKSGAQNFLYGRGIEIAEGGSFKGDRFAVLNNEDVGVYIDRGVAEMTNFSVINNVRGVQLQAIPAGGAKLTDFLIENNAAVGIGITQGSLGIIVQGGRVVGTRPMMVPVDIGGAQVVGDGINWLDGSEVAILNTVRVESSGRAPVIIESTAKGKFEGTLGGGDDSKGIIVQGGLETSMPATLSVASGVKSEVRTKEQALPVAVMMGSAAKTP